MIPFLSLIFLYLLSSCSLYSFTESVTAELPAPPPHWEHVVVAVSLRTYDPDGNPISLDIEAGALRVMLRVPKMSVVPLVAEYRVRGSGAAVRPAGTIYPWYLDEGGALQLSWDLGFVSSVLLSCDSDRVQAVNVPKLVQGAAEKSGGDPWRLDPAALRTSVERNSLDSRRLRLLPAYDGNLPLGEGPWIRDNPLDTATYPSVDGIVHVQRLPKGVCSFFAVSTGVRAAVSALEDGWTVVLPATGWLSTGRW